jgi:hypothetical protein
MQSIQFPHKSPAVPPHIQSSNPARYVAVATNTTSAFSCICYDNSGNYVPTSHDNAASLSSSYEVTAFTTQGNSFLAYLAGFCTNALYAPPGTVVVTTTSVAEHFKKIREISASKLEKFGK